MEVEFRFGLWKRVLGAEILMNAPVRMHGDLLPSVRVL